MSKIVVVGSINMDVVNRLAVFPAPGETVKGYSTEYIPGGKGANQAVAAALAGSNVRMVGAVGDDPFSSTLIASLEQYGVNTEHISSKPGTSGLAFITVEDSGENRIILSEGSNGKLSPEDLPHNVLKDADAVLLQNEIAWDTTLQVLKLCKQWGVATYFNPAPAIHLNDDVLALLHTLIVNETEAEYITGKSVQSIADGEQAARSLLASGVSQVIVTLGSQGSIYANHTGELIHTPAFKVEHVVDTTAAGDTFIGAFASASGRASSIGEALRFASAAASITVTRAGAQVSIPTYDEVMELLQKHS